MRILVTGGTGFIGGHLLPALSRDGHSLRILHRSPRQAGALAAFGEPFPGDLGDPPRVAAAARGMDAVVHAAGVIRGNHEQAFMRGNAETAARLARACREAGTVLRLVHLSSLSAFGPAPPSTLPVESDVPSPVSPYGRSKLAAEQALDAGAGDMPVLHLRLTAVYGPGDRETFALFRMASRGAFFIPGGGDRRIQMVFAADVVEAVRAALAGGPPGPYFIAHPRLFTYADLALALGQAVGRRVAVLPVPGLPVRLLAAVNQGLGTLAGRATMFNAGKAREMLAPAWACSTEKARIMLNFSCRTDFPEGALSTFQWYREHHWL
jgi:nucleoside-diphosphate-sugar epimerase